MEQILVGNGSAELIQLAALAFLRPADSALVLGPTFGEYARAARLAGADVTVENLFATESTEILKRVFSVRSVANCPFRVVFICNPNNPTGQCLPNGMLANWAAAHPETIFIVDEAYLPFVSGMPSALALNAAHILVLRSMTKDHALAGLRLGYAVGPVDLIATLTRLRPPWNVNALAQAAGLAALQDEAHLAQTLAQLRHEKDRLVCGLQTLGYSPVPSQTHFFLLPVDNGAAFRSALLAHGILVRDCASFGLPQSIRIAPRRPAENLRLLEVLQAFFKTALS
jgi:histidinol-phosphate aminotransferase